MTRTLLAAALLAVASTTAIAEPVILKPTGGPDNFSVVLGRTHTTTGAFYDEYFILFDGQALVNGQLIAIFQPEQAAMNRIRFKDVELDGVDLAFSSVEVNLPGEPPQSWNWHSMSLPFDRRRLLLTVSGCAGANCGNGNNNGNNGSNATMTRSEKPH